MQPGGSLYGLQHSNPVDTEVAYGNTDNGPISPGTFGTRQDPMVGLRVGGVNVFGGGLGAYQGGVRVGGVGVSGDTSCTDHMVAGVLRHRLGLDQFGGVAGVSGDPAHPDNIIFDITPNPYGGTGISKGGFGHPTCLNNPTPAPLSEPSRRAVKKWRSASALRRSAALGDGTDRRGACAFAAAPVCLFEKFLRRAFTENRNSTI